MVERRRKPVLDRGRKTAWEISPGLRRDTTAVFEKHAHVTPRLEVCWRLPTTLSLATLFHTAPEATPPPAPYSCTPPAIPPLCPHMPFLAQTLWDTIAFSELPCSLSHRHSPPPGTPTPCMVIIPTCNQTVSSPELPPPNPPLFPHV